MSFVLLYSFYGSGWNFHFRADQALPVCSGSSFLFFGSGLQFFVSGSFNDRFLRSGLSSPDFRALQTGILFIVLHQSYKSDVKSPHRPIIQFNTPGILEKCFGKFSNPLNVLKSQ